MVHRLYGIAFFPHQNEIPYLPADEKKSLSEVLEIEYSSNGTYSKIIVIENPSTLETIKDSFREKTVLKYFLL